RSASPPSHARALLSPRINPHSAGFFAKTFSGVRPRFVAGPRLKIKDDHFTPAITFTAGIRQMRSSQDGRNRLCARRRVGRSHFADAARLIPFCFALVNLMDQFLYTAVFFSLILSGERLIVLRGQPHDLPPAIETHVVGFRLLVAPAAALVHLAQSYYGGAGVSLLNSLDLFLMLANFLDQS